MTESLGLTQGLSIIYLGNRLADQTTNPLSLEGEGWGEGD